MGGPRRSGTPRPEPPRRTWGPPASFRILSSTRSVTSDPRVKASGVAVCGTLLPADEPLWVQGRADLPAPSHLQIGKRVSWPATPPCMGPWPWPWPLPSPTGGEAAGLNCPPGLSGPRKGMTTHTNRNYDHLGGFERERFIPSKFPKPKSRCQQRCLLPKPLREDASPLSLPTGDS